MNARKSRGAQIQRNNLVHLIHLHGRFKTLNVIGEPLKFLTNAFLQQGKFPNHLKRAHVVPIYKNGDAEEPNNYRAIPITSALSKVFQKKLICNQILEHLERSNLLSQIQFGFRANYSTTDALWHATEK